MNRRAFLALLGAAPMASYVPVRSYFFAPHGGWRPSNAVIQLYDAMGKVLSETPFRLEVDGRGYVNIGDSFFYPTSHWGVVRNFGVRVNGSELIYGSFTVAKTISNGDKVALLDGALTVDNA